MAILRRQYDSEVLHHTDRGAIYASDEYAEKLSNHRLVPSMSRKGDCYDNAVAESFFSTLKNELTLGAVFDSKEQARSEIFSYIESFYNRQRIHQSLDYVTPEMMERRFVA
jgi:transposase InsO family protein